MTTALSGPAFLPAGYLYKTVMPRPDGLAAPGVEDILSVSGCISPAFADYASHWKHNGFWLFDRPEDMAAIAAEEGAELATMALFYIEVLAREFDTKAGAWRQQALMPDEPVLVRPPDGARLMGYDVVSFAMGNAPECSPLSCNGLAATIPVNRHCLFDTPESAKAALEQGLFRNAEPGPYRIMAVYRCDQSAP